MSRSALGSSELPIARDEARAAASGVLDHPGADSVEVLVSGSHAGLTRYARSEIIQNTLRSETRAHVRVATDGRVATATTSQLDSDSLSGAAALALEAARASRPDPEHPGSPSPAAVGRARGAFRFDEATAETSAHERALAVRHIIAACGADNASGIYETRAQAWGMWSSAGIDCYDAYTRCVVTCLVDDGDATGWGAASSHARTDVDVERAAGRAADKARNGRAPTDLDPGVYEVVLEPAAVAALLDYLSYAGFGAKQMLEGESFLASRRGETVASRAVTVADDVHHPRSVGIAFDFEGVPRRRVAVIDRGVAVGPVTDLRTARALGSESSGHFSGSYEVGPYAWNLVLEPGDESLDDLVGSVDDGLLVTRFHYVNILDRPATLLTGMTRDGTFRISKGEIVGAVHNLRFTQSALDALGAVAAIGRDLVAFAPEYGSLGSTVAPALRLERFRFTSRTSH